MHKNKVLLYYFTLFFAILKYVDAIVLKSTPYEEDSKILKIFTRDSGLLSVIVKKLGKKGSFWQTATSPLSRGEFHLTRRQSDLYTLQEVSLTDSYIEIRSDLSKLDAACTILRSLLTSQYPEKASPELYQLAIVYLKKLKTFTDPSLLALSFQMKLLNFEGLFSELREPFFSDEEWLTLECLCHAKHFDLLESLTVSPKLQKQASDLFAMRIAEGGT